jgi:hypothetical protein
VATYVRFHNKTNQMISSTPTLLIARLQAAKAATFRHSVTPIWQPISFRTICEDR